MRDKLLALGVAVALFTFAGKGAATHRAGTPGASAASIELIPRVIGDYRLSQHWKNALDDSALEEGALYSAAAAGDVVQLDFFRNYPNTHNGIACYLAKGEIPVSLTLRSVRVHGASAVFNIAVLRAGEQLRLVAATECTRHGCSEQPLPFGSGFRWRIDRGGASDPHDAVVPFSLVLLHAIGPEGVESAQVQLFDEFEQVAAQLDLAPAQRLAAIQGATDATNRAYLAKE